MCPIVLNECVGKIVVSGALRGDSLPFPLWPQGRWHSSAGAFPPPTKLTGVSWKLSGHYCLSCLPISSIFKDLVFFNNVFFFYFTYRPQFSILLSSHFLPCLPFLNGDPRISKGTIQIVQDNSSWWCQMVSDLKFIYYLGCSLSDNVTYLYVLVIQ